MTCWVATGELYGVGSQRAVSHDIHARTCSNIEPILARDYQYRAACPVDWRLTRLIRAKLYRLCNSTNVSRPIAVTKLGIIGIAPSSLTILTKEPHLWQTLYPRVRLFEVDGNEIV